MSTDDLSTPRNWRAIVIGLALAVMVVGMVGIIGKVTGSGWFGHRVWLYDGGMLYALNLSDSARFVSVDGGERVEIAANGAELVELLGGTSFVEVSDESGAVLRTHEVRIDRSHAFVKLSDDGCLAVVDITQFYAGGTQGKLDFEAYIKPKQHLWIPQSRNVVWPRKDFPSRLEAGEGEGVWFEIVACELFDEPDYLDAYLSVRLESRMAKAMGKKK